MKSELLKMGLVLGSLSWIGPFAIDMYLPAMPIIAENLNASVSASQATLMAFFLSFGITQLFYGPAADTFGRKRPLYFGLVVFACASLGCAFATSVEMLIGMRFVQGVGAAAVMSIPRAVIRDRYTGNEATRLMATIMLVVSVAPMLAPLLGSAVIVPFGWRAVFVVVASASGIALLVTRFGLKETLAPENRAAFRFGHMLRSFGILFRDGHFMGLTLIGSMGMGSFFVFLATSSFLYMEYYGLSSFQYSLAFALNALGFFIATQVAANLEARFGVINVIKVAVSGFCAGGCTLFVLVMFGLDQFPLLVAVLFCTYACLGLVIPTSMVLSLENHGPIAGTAAALGGTLQMVIGAIAIALIGLVFNNTPVPLAGAIALCGIGSLLLSRGLLGKEEIQSS